MPRNVAIRKRCQNRSITCTCCGGRSGTKHPRSARHRTAGGGKKSLGTDGLNVGDGWYLRRGAGIPSCRLELADERDEDTAAGGLECEACYVGRSLLVDHATGLVYCGECWAEHGFVTGPQHDARKSKNQALHPNPPPRRADREDRRDRRRHRHPAGCQPPAQSVVVCDFGVTVLEEFIQSHEHRGRPPQPVVPLFTVRVVPATNIVP